MNLKESFRYQNKLESFLQEALFVLRDPDNITKTKETQLRRKANPDAEDETTIIAAESPYADHINCMTRFVLFLLSEKETLFAAIRKAKNALPVDIDSEVSLNVTRQAVAKAFQAMTDLKGSDRVIKDKGIGYCFNNEGNQISYRCDIKRVITINFDRNAVRKELAGLNKKSDEVSSKVDWCMVTSEVDYVPPFDVNLTFAEAFETFMETPGN